MNLFRPGRRVLGVSLAAVALLCGAASAVLGVCGPFTDVTDMTFCPFVLEIFYFGSTTGTSPTTYDPSSSVSRLQMAAFLSRTVDGVLKRGSRRAALRQLWTPQNAAMLGLTTVGLGPDHLESDGLDIWVANHLGNTVSRVRASDGALLATWTGAFSARRPIVALGRIVVLGETIPGNIYTINPSAPAGSVTLVASTLGNFPVGITFDGAHVWTANSGTGVGSVSIVTPGPAIPWAVSTVTAGFTTPFGALYDGTNVWVTDDSADRLFRLNGAGSILQTVTVGNTPGSPAFDGTNIWVPNGVDNSISVVRASNGDVLQTLTGNVMNFPVQAAFDGERVLVTNSGGDSVSLFKAADLRPLGSFLTGAGTGPRGACSDGISFWITLPGSNQIARF